MTSSEQKSGVRSQKTEERPRVAAGATPRPVGEALQRHSAVCAICGSNAFPIYHLPFLLLGGGQPLVACGDGMFFPTYDLPPTTCRSLRLCQDALVEIFVKGNNLLATESGRGAFPRRDAHLLATLRVGDDLEGACGHGFHVMTRH